MIIMIIFIMIFVFSFFTTKIAEMLSMSILCCTFLLLFPVANGLILSTRVFLTHEASHWRNEKELREAVNFWFFPSTKT